MTGENLANTIIELLEKLGLSINYLRGQGYDGAANMSGKFKGTQTYILKQQPLAVYIHCYSHCLNLALVKACSIQPVRNMIGIVEEVTNFIRDSPKRLDISKNLVKNNCPDINIDILLKLCTTRWVERHEAFIRFDQMLPAILEFLEHIIQNSEGSILTKANGLYNSILNFQIILTLQIVVKIMQCTLPLSRQLQCPKFDMSGVQILINSTLNVPKGQRNEVEFSNIFNKAQQISNTFDIEIKIPRVINKQRNRNNTPTDNNPEFYYRTSIYFTFTDFVIAEMETKLSIKNNNISNLKGIIPKYCESTEFSNIVESAAFYISDLPGTLTEFEGELKTWILIWKQKTIEQRPSTVSETLSSSFIKCYPNIERLLIIYGTIPITTCTAERSFSSIKRIKTYLRSVMGENRLNGLALMNIHPEITFLPEEVIDMYAKTHPRRLQLLL